MKMKRWRVTGAVGALLALAGFNGNSLAATTHDVTISGFTFNPANLTVQAGDSVKWTHQVDFAAHTSTSGTPPGTPDGLWDSGLLVAGQSFTRQFDDAGTFPYYCEPHFTSMIGSILVQGGGVNQPPAVSITSPTNNASFPVTNTVEIVATATDDGSVAQVQFYDGATLLGADTTSPFAFNATLSVGGHALTARVHVGGGKHHHPHGADCQSHSGKDRQGGSDD
jgi:plastocyanin